MANLIQFLFAVKSMKPHLRHDRTTWRVDSIGSHFSVTASWPNRVCAQPEEWFGRDGNCLQIACKFRGDVILVWDFAASARMMPRMSDCHIIIRRRAAAAVARLKSCFVIFQYTSVSTSLPPFHTL